MYTSDEDIIQKMKNERLNDQVVFTATELMSLDMDDDPTLFDPVFPKTGLAVVAGSSDTGKSILLRNMALCASLGIDFIGFRYKGKHQSCIYVSTEDDKVSIRNYLKRHNTTLKRTPESFSGLRFVFTSENIIDVLGQELSSKPADLVVVDAYSDVFDGKDQNNSAQTRQFLHGFKSLSAKYECLIIFLHHTGKRTEELAPSKNNLVGSQAFEAAVRVGIELRTDKNDPTLRHFCIVKGNYLGNEYKTSSYVLKMDSNFIFSNTGERVCFDELSNEKRQTEIRKFECSPSDYTDQEHKDFLLMAAGIPISKTALNTPVCKHFGISDRTARKFVSHYIENKFLKEVKIGTSIKYVSCDSELPF